MKNDVTKHTLRYPKGQAPNLIEPIEFGDYRYAIGKEGGNPLVAICMNPSAATDEQNDKTINRIINISVAMKCDGWIVFNLYPERATNQSALKVFDQDIMDKNIQYIKKYLLENKIKEVWGAWGNTSSSVLKESKPHILKMLNEIKVSIFYFGNLTKAGNPRHPSRAHIEFSEKHYL